MEKRSLLLTIMLLFFMLASVLLVLKLEKKGINVSGCQTISKNKQLDADILFQTYGTTFCEINDVALPVSERKKNSRAQLFLESKIYAASVDKPLFFYCTGDSSLSATIYNHY